MKVVPIGKSILIELDSVQEREVRPGVWASEKHAEKTRFGTILALGDQVNRDDEGNPTEERFKVGDRIIIGNHTGNYMIIYELNWINPDHRMITEYEIMGKLEE